MDSEEFCLATSHISNFIVDYMNKIREEKVLTEVKPGYLAKLMEEQCPKNGTNFMKIFQEFLCKILPGVTHWNSPHFHAYFPAGFSYATLLSELLIAGLNTVDVNWEACPASVELEIIVLNWLAKSMNLPEEFLTTPNGTGGGCLQTTSGEVTLLSMVAARKRALKKWRLLESSLSEEEISSKLVAYGSEQAHFSVERGGLIAGMRMRLLPCDETGSMRGNTLRDAVTSDLNAGLFPCYVVATVGTTGICSVDHVEELGKVCREFNLWMHVDAAYAGAALICPEFRHLANGLNYAESFSIGLHKWMYMSYDVVAYWLKNRKYLEDALAIDRVYIQHKNANAERTLDFVNMQIGTGRKFRSLKVWMVLKNVGVDGMQNTIRRHVRLGNLMHELLMTDGRFAIVNCSLGTVCFRLKKSNEATKKLRELINTEGNIMLTPCSFQGKYLIRFVINYSTRDGDVNYAWEEILRCTNQLGF